MLVPSQVTDLMQTSDVVGNIRFTHPTLYIFPGGQGDSALFGINGFNMLGKTPPRPINQPMPKRSANQLPTPFQLTAASTASPASGTLLATWTAWMRC